jgi:hypothetical protein
MKSRYLADAIKTFCFADHKIGFISGPRQCGKTTFSKALLAERGAGAYWNWDDIEFRRRWVKSPQALTAGTHGGSVPIIVLDEIHKDRRWKRTLKGMYDVCTAPSDILVTGSARLDVYRKGSDSLLGRYLSFRLHPFTLREMTSSAAPLPPDQALQLLFSGDQTDRREYITNLAALMEFGPFPQPLLAQDPKKARLWRQSRREIVIREDIRDISRIPELGRIELMVALLPEKVGSLFSINSVREDLEVGFDAVKRWLTCLRDLYYLYEVKPWHRSIPRGLKKEGKVYFWDFSEVPDTAARFENLVGNHLLKACHYWSDTGEGDFALFYLRDKEKREIDFLIVRDGKPWLPVEAKLSDATPSPSWKAFLPVLGCHHAIQILAQPHWETRDLNGVQLLIAGADRVLPTFA